jgi:predicted TPR repeat methyltransferase
LDERVNPVEDAILLLDEGRPQAALALMEPLAASGRLGPLGRLTHGRALLSSGKPGEAVAVLREAVALDRTSPEAAVVFGQALAANGALPTAIAEFQRALRCDPDFGAAHFALAQAWAAAGEPERAGEHLAAAGTGGFDVAALKAELDAMRGAARANAGYVRALFDQFSADYDERMRGKLGYRAPEVLLDLALMVSGGAMKKAQTLDLGCGTGLAAPLFAPHAKGLTGVDLSRDMLARARVHPYTELIEADIETWLHATPERFGRVIAADVLVYLGDLSKLFAGVRRVLKPGGLLLFTVERYEGSEGFVQLPTKRWAHTDAYLQAQAEAHGFDVRGLIQCTPRYNAGMPIPGLAGAFALL